ncbi:MAG: isoleucine--tRNA ligase [Leuconostoc falkenbergense]|uniref:Isoleucine--tRNA ligase n=2 Tax=Leuconostoc falkenbergense TaxID=2766470 RepID=A0A9X3E9N7_9LACO|nr:isoleucine--tRNA ligase [Leuconostoc falkenbergense]VTU66619.1 isoleucine--tRNA ligase [Lactobacillus agilis] [Leuconostoc pseudomesenteroides]MCT4390314.1 isoleucine--tRNA ligase [Leuconostoc falkenbergense]MCT4410457.1 isoleucine--tRNA ligase [Leuconostoc falkenbergense]MCX7579467.1 isoleucine--tRNA ligase [Leuconostoc falkenbergense]MDM7646219.1 isoleucine--tRNA ligase [Leuconostoc falkenbergense]
MKYKDTLNLGKTAFPMRGSLPKTEPERQAKWYEEDLYQQRLAQNEKKPHFNLHDGPPYANGNIHIGHAMNKITKDIIVRYKNMTGFYAPYVPGWDTHGLPIEQQLTKAGHDRKSMPKSEWRNLAKEFALQQVNKQRSDFKRLGVLGDWENPYITLKPEFEAAQIRVFGAMAGKGYIFRGAKPVYWSWSSESALAEAEIEYHDIDSTSLFYANKVKDGKGILDDNTYFVVWTTTPFTVTASRGITLGPDFEYSVVIPAGDTRQFVVATELLDSVAPKFGWESYETVATYKGQELDRITAYHPWDSEHEELVMNADHVTLDSGTGLVHTAPGFGEDDYNVGKKYGLPADVTVDSKGYMTANAGADFEGKFYDDVVGIVINKLTDAGLFLAKEKITHSYPFDWRTKKPIIWRAVPQWFASVAKFRSEILAELDKVTYFPDWGKVRLHNMIRDRGDWVISRQRVWGVPLPIFYAEDGTAILDEKLINHVADLFAEYGSNYWFEHDAKELLPEGYTNEHSPNGEFTKEEDIMDVWFDSGSSWNGVLNTRPELDYPADMYLEGSDQFRGWFNSSLITSVAVNGIAPYKSILHQGFTLDGKGNKMSKSLGNTISPLEVADKMGIEILRLWVTSVDTSQDMRVSNEILKQVSESYRKLRNTLRFLLANTSDFDPKEDGVSYQSLAAHDQYFYALENNFVKDVRNAYDNYQFNDVFKRVINFVNVDLSAFYLDVAKDVVYVEAPTGQARRSMQTVFYKILTDLTRLLLPILPHTAEEVWEYLPYETAQFAYLTDMPDVQDLGDTTVLFEQWSTFMSLRDAVNKALEEARETDLIGKNAEASLTLYLTTEQQLWLKDLNADVRLLLMVSQLHLESLESAQNVQDFAGWHITVAHATGQVSPRDRLYHDDIGSDTDFPELSKHEADIVREFYPEALTEGLE